MTQKMGYLIDLHTLQFDELDNGKSTSWIQAMPLGTYNHPEYGVIEITPERVERFAQNVNNGIRGIDLDIDYDHKEKTNEAAGWVQQAKAVFSDPDPKKNGLWILVEWVKEAKEKILSKAYRYFSPEFIDEWNHPQSGETYKDVLFGGGLTNRPFLKGILPLNLSESFEKTKEGSQTMTPEQLKEMAKRLGLPDDATPEMIYGAFVSKGDIKEVTPDPVENEGAPTDGNGEPVDAGAPPAQLSENDAVKTLAEHNRALAEELKTMRVESTVAKLSEMVASKGRLLPVSTKEKVTALLSESGVTKKLSDSVVALLSDFISELPIAGEGSNGRQEGDRKGGMAFHEKTVAYAAEHKLSYADAAVAMARIDPDAYDQHRAGE